MRWKVVVPASSPPVARVDVKQHLRVDTTDDDALINALIAAAVAYVEEIGGMSLAQRTIEAYLPSWPGVAWLSLPRPPVHSVVFVRYRDLYGNVVDMPASDYVAIEHGIWSASWPSAPLARDVPEPITIRYVAGYDVIPAPIRHALLLLVAHWYEHREAAEVGHISREVAFGVDALLAPYRRWA